MHQDNRQQLCAELVKFFSEGKKCTEINFHGVLKKLGKVKHFVSPSLLKKICEIVTL